MDRDTGVLVSLEGHPGLVPVRIFARGSGRLRNAPGPRRNRVACDSFLLRYRNSILRRTRICRRARHGGDLAPNHCDLGSDNLLGGRILRSTTHCRQARLLTQTSRRSVGRIVLRHLPRTDSIRVRRLGPHNSSISN